ncbi:hypothetical protein KP509_38G016700 [Ceratopteris richardii]|uniref:Uncharacterized protein n=1 Tax=Ceratopteris richardii TaxID=49495 RepID=A0A8T2Q2R7_CERRI|nr:hypothetical protein KP509_38G016700 [Ceratopteris richardii]KAH7277950.1 hypothetical protein KP509_38G016700 [Ceratopteris richardii]KAH7277951.1 hypothetical protein KP509_38G016700 [Ceratopteris richardii]
MLALRCHWSTRFFQTDAELDLTVVSCEIVAPEFESLALDTSRLSQRSLRRGRMIFIMGCQVKDPENVVILEGGILGLQKHGGVPSHIAFQAGESPWIPGSAGFDEFGTFSFIVIKPSRRHLQRIMQSSDLKNLYSSKFPKQQAISVQVAKEWMEPFWRMNRDEVFQGPELCYAGSIPISDNRLNGSSFPEVHAHGQKHVMLHNDAILGMDGGTSTCDKDLRYGKKAEKSMPHHALPPSKLPKQMRPTTECIGVEMAPYPSKSNSESPNHGKAVPQRTQKPSSDVAPILQEQRTKREDFKTLKHKKGLKRLMDRAMKKAENTTETVSVQTELFVDHADEKPILIMGEPEGPSEMVQKVQRRNTESWSLPVNEHGSDPHRGDDEPTPLPVVIRQNRASMPLSGNSYINAREVERSPARMGKYNVRGQSLSDPASRASSVGSTPSRAHHHTRIHGLDYGIASVSGSSSPRAQEPAVYSKPTISYAQKRNPGQRDVILARQASLPRWAQ